MKRPISPIASREKRFDTRVVELTLWQSFVRFFKSWRWETTKVVLDEIKPDDPRFKNAPYAQSFIVSDFKIKAD